MRGVGVVRDSMCNSDGSQYFWKQIQSNQTATVISSKLFPGYKYADKEIKRVRAKFARARTFPQKETHTFGTLNSSK
eukprot:5901244-Amphidinium_carterae.1